MIVGTRVSHAAIRVHEHKSYYLDARLSINPIVKYQQGDPGIDMKKINILKAIVSFLIKN